MCDRNGLNDIFLICHIYYVFSLYLLNNAGFINGNDFSNSM